jgi:predicted XRE-type DNA-binding protein
LRARTELMQKISAVIEAKKWKQAEAATRCGVTQPRINDLLQGRIARFSLDALVNIASALGQRVHVELEAA